MMTRMVAIPLMSLAACMATLPAEAGNARCAPLSKPDVVLFFQAWDKALATGNPDIVVARYAPDAVLLPTLSDKPRKNRSEIKDYFVEFLKKHPRGTIDERTIRLGCNEAFDVGLYTFLVDGPEPNQRVAVKARFSFIYEVRNGRWMITHHHSSELPHHAALPETRDVGRDLVRWINRMEPAKDRCVPTMEFALDDD